MNLRKFWNVRVVTTKTREKIHLKSFVQARDRRERVNYVGRNVVRNVDIESTLLQRFHDSGAVETSHVRFLIFT